MRPNQNEFSLRARFRHALKKSRIQDGSRLLVAVSGGCDSVSLLHLVLAEAPQRNWTVHVGHVDHGLRPDSRDDAEFVRGLCHALDVPSHGLRVREEAWSRRRGESVEAAARSLRRKALRTIALRNDLECVLLGQTRDDQAETILLRLLRGSGVRGLGAMRVRRGRWIRPLLSIGREELRSRATRHGLEWREDPWNQDPRFDRVRVRRQILPALEEAFGPSVHTVLSRSASALHSVSDFLDEQVTAAWQELSPHPGPGPSPDAVCDEPPQPGTSPVPGTGLDTGPTSIRLERARLATYHPAVTEGILRRAFRAVGGHKPQLGLAHIRALEEAVRSTKPRSFDLPGNVQATVNAREVRLVKGIEES